MMPFTCYQLSILFMVILWQKLTADKVWEPTKHLQQWYHPFDLCLLSDARNISIDIITKECAGKLEGGQSLLPVRCRVGNTWPSRSAYCDPTDIPFKHRSHLFESISHYDNPQNSVLKEFFYALAAKHGLLLIIGDSVMQQFFSALACELEREGVWKDPSKFTNTDEPRSVIVPQGDGINKTAANVQFGLEGAATASIRFLPVYHLVNGRHDRVPQQAMHSLKKSLKLAVASHKTIVILINMGLHYVDNPVPGYTKQDYRDQMTTVLTHLHAMVLEHPSHTIKILWRETTAQHFPTTNGYWPGVRYAHSMSLAQGCQPIHDPSPAADWRNRLIEEIITQERFTRTIEIVRFYNITVPLWSEHPNGHLRDCTHFCWSPMLYQPIFHAMRNSLLLHPSSSSPSDATTATASIPGKV